MLVGYSDFILLFLKLAYHQTCFEIVNEITPKIYDLILEFHTTKFYIVSLIVYGMK
jgi:hypothetical protein